MQNPILSERMLLWCVGQPAVLAFWALSGRPQTPLHHTLLLLWLQQATVLPGIRGTDISAGCREFDRVHLQLGAFTSIYDLTPSGTQAYVPCSHRKSSLATQKRCCTLPSAGIGMCALHATKRGNKTTSCAASAPWLRTAARSASSKVRTKGVCHSLLGRADCSRSVLQQPDG